MIKALAFDFCEMQIYDTYLIAIMKEGIHLNPEKNDILVDIAEIYFANKPFVYITHRKNSYSVDPSIYIKTSNIENLSGFAVVASVPLAKGNAEIERLFLNKPFEIFGKIEEAVYWANQLSANTKS